MSAAPAAIESCPRRVLVVDDEAGMRAALEVSFRRREWEVEAACGKSDALARLRQRTAALVVTDIRMPDGNGFEVMRAARELSAKTAVILLTAFASVPEAVTAMKSGACEYLVKPVPFEQLLETAERIVAADAPDHGIVGSSPALVRALELARQAARSDADVLIEAESGTGKELLARMIHALSSRHSGRLVAVNCAGIPEPLLESELFGHARGAFTGAERAQAGKFELADGGTLLLDEIGEMPLSLQPKLLRALQEREVYPLGQARPVKVNLRVIATTNHPLLAMVRQGAFRADLYYRLNVVPLSLPPLRERREDIRELTLHFARQFSPAGSRPPELPESFLAQLEKYSWPGNVRELANLIRRGVALGTLPALGDPVFTLDSQIPGIASVPAVERIFGRHVPALHAGLSLQAVERRLLEMTLDATRGNRSRTAEMLGVSLRTVRNKIREYNLPPRSEYAHD
jgi:DNA-binding NtrC family response regulator